MTPILKLPFLFDTVALKADVLRFGPEEWTPHFNTHNYKGDWSGIALRAPQNAHVALYPDPTASEYSDTAAMERCTCVPEVIKTFACGLESVRFLRLGAGAKILEHRDYKLAFEDGVARIHIPVETNPDVEFILGGGRVDMKEGEAWYLNFNLRHSVDNKGDNDRVHLVIDCIVNDWLRSFFPAAEIGSDSDFH